MANIELRSDYGNRRSRARNTTLCYAATPASAADKSFRATKLFARQGRRPWSSNNRLRPRRGCAPKRRSATLVGDVVPFGTHCGIGPTRPRRRVRLPSGDGVEPVEDGSALRPCGSCSPGPSRLSGPRRPRDLRIPRNRCAAAPNHLVSDFSRSRGRWTVTADYP